MKIILVIITLPGTWERGREIHTPFDSFEQCEVVRERVNIGDRVGWSYCTSRENETWYYLNLAPTGERGSE